MKRIKLSKQLVAPKLFKAMHSRNFSSFSDDYSTSDNFNDRFNYRDLRSLCG